MSLDDSDNGVSGLVRDALRAGGSVVPPDALPWYSWGGVIWRFSDNAYVHPTNPHPGGPAEFHVLIQLRRNDDPYVQPLSPTEGAFIGDSELDASATGLLEFMHGGGADVPSVRAMFVPNEHGRVGAIGLTFARASRLLDVYRLAQTAFNSVATDVAVRHAVPLRRSAMLISRIGEVQDEIAIVAPVQYPVIPASIEFAHTRAMRRLYATFSEGLASSSPFYAFLCFFTLVEFMIGPLQGRLRRLNHQVPIEFENLNGVLTAEECRFIGHFLEGTSYHQMLEQTRNQRNAVAHFLIELSSRPFSVVAEDQIAFHKDALKVAARNLIQIADRNVKRFLQAGVAGSLLLTVFEGRAWDMSRLVALLEKRRQYLEERHKTDPDMI